MDSQLSAQPSPPALQATRIQAAPDAPLKLVRPPATQAQEDAALTARMREAVGPRTYLEVARSTNMHPETVRRYFRGGRPSAIFLTALCRAYNIRADWLLEGEGEMRRDARPVHPARQPKAVQEATTEANPDSAIALPPRRTRRVSGRARIVQD